MQQPRSKPDALDLAPRRVRPRASPIRPTPSFPSAPHSCARTGRVVTGANVENRSFGLSNCAERSALFAAVSQGKRASAAIAVFCPRSEVPGLSLRRLPAGAQRVLPAGDARVLRREGRDVRRQRRSGSCIPQDSLHGLKNADSTGGSGTRTARAGPAAALSASGLLLRLLQIVFHLGAPDLGLLLDHVGLVCFPEHDVKPAHGGQVS